MMVMVYAIGSLLPDSSSSIEPRFSRRCRFLPCRIENTDALSVEPIMAASKKQPSTGAPYTSPSIKYMAPPASSTVSITPTVESRMPCLITGLVCFREVSRPAVSRMMDRAKCPMDSASSYSSK